MLHITVKDKFRDLIEIDGGIIKIYISKIKGNRARVSIDAPKNIRIERIFIGDKENDEKK